MIRTKGANAKFYEFEKINYKIIKIFIKKNYNELLLNLNNLNLERTTEKYLHNVLHNSKVFYNLFCDILNNNYKKKYELESFELKLLAIELAKLLNVKNIAFSYKKNFLEKTFFFSLYFFFISFFYLFKFKKRDRKELLCLLNHNKFKDKFKILLKNINIKKSFININIIIKKLITFKIKLSFNLNFNFKNSLIQDKFYFMHKIYLRAYIYNAYIISNNPYFILFFEGDAADHEIVATIGDKNNINTVCVQWGSFMFAQPKNSFRNSGFKIFLVWSKFYKDKFKKYNKIPKIVPIGNCFINNNKFKKNKILFLLPQLCNEISRKQLETFCKIINWASNEYPGEITLRTHPQINQLNKINVNLSLSNLIIHDGNKIPLSESFLETYLLITCGSSCIFEAGKIGIIPLLFLDKIENIWSETINNLNKKYKIKLIDNNNIENIKYKIQLIRNNELIRKQISQEIRSNFNMEIDSIGVSAIKKYTQFFQKLIYS